MSGGTTAEPTLHIAPGDRDLARSLAREDVRAALAAQLPAWLRPKRWFGGQTRDLTEVRFDGWVSLADGSATEVEGRRSKGELAPEEGGAETPVVLCVIRATDTEGATTHHPLFLHAAADGTVGEGLERPAARRQLLALLLGGGEVRGVGLRLVGDPVGPVEGLMVDLDPLHGDAHSRIIDAQQSNSSIVYGERAIMKVYRRLEAGANPEVELGRFLSVEAGLDAIPRVHASGRLIGDGTTLPADFDAALLILQDFVPPPEGDENGGDAWEWSLAQGGAALAVADNAAGLDRWLADNPALPDAAAELGRTTARMHAALATATGDELRPRTATAADVATWASAVGQEAQATTASLTRSGHDDPALGRAIEAAQVYPPPEVAAPGLLTRVHGDYHLGQIIRGASGFMVLDFEGEPARPLAFRRRPQHPLVDVAGMARSWGYAAHVAAGEAGKAALAEHLEAALRERFLAAYWAEAAAAPQPFLPVEHDDRLALLRLFELTKALYEVRYELDNRPEMVTIPSGAIKRLMGMANDE